MVLWLEVNSYFQNLKVKTLKSERDSAYGAIELQNSSVQAWKEDAERFKAKVEDSNKAADKIAFEVKKAIDDISKQPIPTDCSGAVDVARKFMEVQQ